MIRAIYRYILLAIATSAISLTALADTEYPVRPVKIVVPVPPGFSTDMLARLLAEKLTPLLGQTVIVENRSGGAGGNVGAEYVSRSEPDGYTLLFAATGPLAVNKVLYRDLRYDPSAFSPISLVASIPNVLVARPDAPFSDLSGLISYAKANPAKLNYASGGSGTTTHLSAELLKDRAGLNIVHVPYRGSAAAVNGLMQGQADLMFTELSSTMELIKAGRLKAIAIGSQQRNSALPAIPTVSETLPGFRTTVWYGIVAPPSTPPTITSKLANATAEIMRSATVIETLHNIHIEAVGSSPEELTAFAESEAARWEAVIQKANIAN